MATDGVATMLATAEAYRDNGSGLLTHVGRGMAIAQQNHRVREVHVIVSGVVYLESRVDCESVMLGFRARGRPLCVVPAVLGTAQPASAIALTDCAICSTPIAEFHRLRTGSMNYGLWLQQMEAQEVEDQLRHLRMWATSRCEDRLDQLMVELVAVAGEDRPDGSIKLKVPIGVERFSALARMRRETASRHFGRRVKARTLSKQQGWFVVPDGSDLIDRIRSERRRLAGMLQA